MATPIGKKFNSQRGMGAKATVEGLSANQMEAELLSRDVLLLDLRRLEERAQDGFVAGSVFIPYGQLKIYADASNSLHFRLLVPSVRVILMCENGDRSVRGAATLAQLGFHRVAYLAGGLKAWKRAGKDLLIQSSS